MADGYLENRYAEYEKRKAQWQKSHKPKTPNQYGRSNSQNPS